jgi:hypothetical protein
MAMKKLNLLIISGFLYILSYGQEVPGYMGLKFSVKYDAGIMLPAVVGRTGALPMLYNNVSLDYVVTRQVSVGVKYCYMTYNAPAEVKQFSGTDYTNTDYKGRFTGQTAAFMVKLFPKRAGFIAPFGRYASFGVYYQHVVDNEATAFQGGDIQSQSPASSPTGFRGIANYGGFIIGGGRNYIVANRIILDLGCNISVPLGIYNLATEMGTEKTTIYRDVALRNLLQLYLGFGVLAF